MVEIGLVPPKRRPEAALEGELVTLAIAAGPQSNPPPQAGDGASRGTARGTGFRQCPKCGEAAPIRLEGCDQCTSCDYSECGETRCVIGRLARDELDGRRGRRGGDHGS